MRSQPLAQRFLPEGLLLRQHLSCEYIPLLSVCCACILLRPSKVGCCLHQPNSEHGHQVGASGCTMWVAVQCWVGVCVVSCAGCLTAGCGQNSSGCTVESVSSWCRMYICMRLLPKQSGWGYLPGAACSCFQSGGCGLLVVRFQLVLCRGMCALLDSTNKDTLTQADVPCRAAGQP